MKNFIFFPLIALIFLCSCKSNSFMTQRYTHLSHSHNVSKKKTVVAKNNKAPKVLNKQEVIISAPLSTNELTEEPVTTAAVAVDPSDLEASSEVKKISFPKRLVSPLLSSGNKTFSSIKTETKNSSSENIAKKKTLKEKLQHAAGLLNTAFKIVLFAIILAILVALIIILVIILG